MNNFFLFLFFQKKKNSFYDGSTWEPSKARAARPAPHRSTIWDHTSKPLEPRQQRLRMHLNWLAYQGLSAWDSKDFFFFKTNVNILFQLIGGIRHVGSGGIAVRLPGGSCRPAGLAPSSVFVCVVIARGDCSCFCSYFCVFVFARTRACFVQSLPYSSSAVSGNRLYLLPAWQRQVHVSPALV